MTTGIYKTSRRTAPSVLEYLIVLLLICFSGNPAFVSSGILSKVGALVLAVLAFVLFFPRIGKHEYKIVAGWMLFLTVIFAAQYLTLHYISPLACLNFMAKMLTAILVPMVIGPKFRVIYLRLMAFFGLISLCFFFLNLCGVYFPSLIEIETKGESLFVYTQMKAGYDGSLYRNSGMFWEPGAFSGYIIFAFLLYVDNLRFLIRRHLPEVLILVVCLITTFSTAGYILLAILAVYYLMAYSKNRALKYSLLVVAVPAIIVAFVSLDFLGEKIVGQFKDIENVNTSKISYERIGSLIFDSQYIALHPLFGNGLPAKTRYSLHQEFPEELLAAFSNGFSGCLASMGVLFMLVYLISIWKNPSLKRKALVIFVVVLSLQSEYFLNYPLFLSLPYVNFAGQRLLNPSRKENKRKIKIKWRD